MAFFSAYILSIVGISLLGVMVDLVLIDGQVKKYVKSIFVLFMIFTLVVPLPNLVDNIKKGQISLPSGEIDIDKSYLDIVLRQKNTAVKMSINLAFQKENILDAKIEINATMLDNIYKINNICIDISKASYRVAHSKIFDIVQSVIDIPKEDIRIYE